MGLGRRRTGSSGFAMMRWSQTANERSTIGRASHRTISLEPDSIGKILLVSRQREKDLDATVRGLNRFSGGHNGLTELVNPFSPPTPVAADACISALLSLAVVRSRGPFPAGGTDCSTLRSTIGRNGASFCA